MNFTGNFERMIRDVIKCYPDYNDRDFITFGILIVDPRQRDVEEYIINYFPLFDIHSARYFDFFIPGFIRGQKQGYLQFNIRGNDYYFDEMVFFSFCEEFCNRFKIPFTYNPMLILMTMQKSDINTAEFIVIELDDNDRNSVRRAGRLFDEIFRNARYTPDLKNLRKDLMKTQIKNHLLKLIISSFNSDCLTEIAETGKEIARYRIKH